MFPTKVEHCIEIQESKTLSFLSKICLRVSFDDVVGLCRLQVATDDYMAPGEQNSRQNRFLVQGIQFKHFFYLQLDESTR